MTFGSSRLGAFVGSPLFARDMDIINVDYIARWCETGASVNWPAGFTQSFPDTNRISPGYRSSIPGRPFQPFPLVGPNVVAATFPNPGIGWIRLTFVAWGLFPICNPWDTPPERLSTHPTSASRFWLIDDHIECYFQTSLPGLVTYSEDVPANRHHPSPPSTNRVPISCCNPVGKFGKLPVVHSFIREIEFSGFNSGSSPDLFPLLPWPNVNFDASFRNAGYFVNPDTSTEVGILNMPFDSTGANPVAPVTWLGRPVTLFQNLPVYGVGICVALRAAVRDTQYRVPVYRDAAMVEMPQGVVL